MGEIPIEDAEREFDELLAFMCFTSAKFWGFGPDHELNPAKVSHLRLRNVKSGALSELPADGVFIAIGHAPATGLVAGQVKLKPSGYVEVAPNSTATSVRGLFAAGDVADEVYRQAVTAAGLGCMAALEAERFLALRAGERAAAE